MLQCSSPCCAWLWLLRALTFASADRLESRALIGWNVVEPKVWVRGFFGWMQRRPAQGPNNFQPDGSLRTFDERR